MANFHHFAFCELRTPPFFWHGGIINILLIGRISLQLKLNNLQRCALHIAVCVGILTTFLCVFPCVIPAYKQWYTVISLPGNLNSRSKVIIFSSSFFAVHVHKCTRRYTNTMFSRQGCVSKFIHATLDNSFESNSSKGWIKFQNETSEYF